MDMLFSCGDEPAPLGNEDSYKESLGIAVILDLHYTTSISINVHWKHYNRKSTLSHSSRYVIRSNKKIFLTTPYSHHIWKGYQQDDMYDAVHNMLLAATQNRNHFYTVVKSNMP